MARVTYKPGESKQGMLDNADVFNRPTILVNCMKNCPNCTALYPFLDDAFKSWLAAKGYALYINKDDVKNTANYMKYGKACNVGSATPQFYAIDGDKAVGVSPVRKGPWTAQEVYNIVEGLIGRMK